MLRKMEIKLDRLEDDIFEGRSSEIVRDISDAAERIWDTLENYKEVIEALESTNESVLSHRLNDSFRILTAVSVVLLPLTLIASIFGMNVPVPGEQQEFSFLAIMLLMGVLLLALVAYFRRRGWL